MQNEINQPSKFQVLNVVAFVVFCFAIGETIAILLTGLLYNLNTSQIFEVAKDPSNVDRSIIVSLSTFSTLFRFLVIPGVYLLFTNKSSLNFLRANNPGIVPLLLTMATIICVIPLISILIELNYNLELPGWLSELERYFKESEEKARLSTNMFLSFRGPKDLIIAIVILAIVPGIAEELFFRGMVQLQFENILKNQHYAILSSAFLFSVMHFQFYGFIPRLVLGALLGYLFVWSKNVWYPCIAHVTNNLIGVLGAYFIGPEIMNQQDGNAIPIVFLFPSVIISALIIFYLKKSFTAKSVISN